jgi:hypothetical protein
MRVGWALVLSLVGCAAQNEVYLRWQAGPPSGLLDGKVALKQVPNLRPNGRGAGSLVDIGSERSATGQVHAVRLEGEANEPLDHIVLRLTIDAMRSAGLAPTQAEDAAATAQLTVEIHEFWCDGTRAAKVQVGLELVLLDPKTGAERLRVPVNTTGTGTSCKAAFQTGLTAAYHELAHAFAEDEVRRTATGASSGGAEGGVEGGVGTGPPTPGPQPAGQ